MTFYIKYIQCMAKRWQYLKYNMWINIFNTLKYNLMDSIKTIFIICLNQDFKKFNSIYIFNILNLFYFDKILFKFIQGFYSESGQFMHFGLINTVLSIHFIKYLIKIHDSIETNFIFESLKGKLGYFKLIIC